MTAVSAVIPTIGREALRRSVESVAAQTLETQAIVVLDRPDRESDVRTLLTGLPYELIVTKGGVGGGAARNAGVKAAASEFVAFLDDDDEWLPEKSARQATLLRDQPRSIVACRTELIGRRARVVPEEVLDPSRQVASYVLSRSTLRLRRNFLQTSSLMTTKAVAEEVGWSARLPKHQDWDFVIRAEAVGLRISMQEEVLVRVFQNSTASISKTSNWRASIEWLETVDRYASARAVGDFEASVALRAALRSREWKAAAGLSARAVRHGCHPAALVVGLSGLLSR